MLRLWHDMCLKCHKCNSESHALISVHHVFCSLLEAVWRVCTFFPLQSSYQLMLKAIWL